MNKDLKVGLILLTCGVFVPLFLGLGRELIGLPIIFVGSLLIGKYIWEEKKSE